jgi:hypothetical protein
LFPHQCLASGACHHHLNAAPTTKAECEAAATGHKEASCLRENNWLIAKKRDH